MKSSVYLKAVTFIAGLLICSAFSQSWQVNGSSIWPVPNYNVWVSGTRFNTSGDQAVLWLGDGVNHYIKAVYGGGVRIGTFQAPDAITISETSGNVTITKGDLILNQGKLNLKNSWTIEAPDYVFEKDYKLPSLQEVEKKINADKHLPDMPSAAEMKEKGVELTEMNMKLLKKMEEMTLYVIEQNKKIEELEKKVESLTLKK